MKLYGVPMASLSRIVGVVSYEKYDDNLTFKRCDENGSHIIFTLKVRNSHGKGAKRSPNGRRSVAADWEAHYNVMKSLFDAHPNARLKSALADYKGKSEFLQKAAATAF
jgi:hypothetical protein